MSFVSWVTWLEGVIPQASDRMCGLPRHSFNQLAHRARTGYFGGQNTEATPYPSTTAFRRSGANCWLPNSVFGSVSQDTHRQALLLGLSWLSFSRPLDLPTVPEPGPGPAPTVTSRRLPTPAHVERTCSRERARTPWADLQPHGCAPTLSMTASMPAHQGLPHRPHSPGSEQAADLSDRTLRLVPGNTKPAVLLQRASVEHGQATLMASGSTGTAHDGWLGHPLSLIGSQVYRVCCPIERSHAAR